MKRNPFKEPRRALHLPLKMRGPSIIDRYGHCIAVAMIGMTTECRRLVKFVNEMADQESRKLGTE